MEGIWFIQASMGRIPLSVTYRGAQWWNLERQDPMTITKSFFFRWRGDKGVMHQILTNRASRGSVNETRLVLLHCDVPISSYDHISLYSTIKGPGCQKSVCNNSSGHPSTADPAMNWVCMLFEATTGVLTSEISNFIFIIQRQKFDRLYWHLPFAVVFRNSKLDCIPYLACFLLSPPFC